MKVTTSIRMVWAALVSAEHLWGALGGVNMLHPLVMSVEQTHHGAAAPDHEANKHGIQTGPQDDHKNPGTRG